MNSTRPLTRRSPHCTKSRSSGEAEPREEGELDFLCSEPLMEGLEVPSEEVIRAVLVGSQVVVHTEEDEAGDTTRVMFLKIVTWLREELKLPHQ